MAVNSRSLAGLVALASMVAAAPQIAVADKPSYTDTIRALSKRRAELSKSVDGTAVSAEIIDAVRSLSSYWLGTRWGLGVPQSATPREGKINCGTFVGTVLRDAGFNVKVSKLQRQPSQLIIESFVTGKRVRKYSNASMKRFLASVKEMGPGLFIIGLDFHVGFLIQTETDLRFVHASYVTETVVDEPASTAVPITTSKYRVVGKLLSKRNIADWLAGRTIRIKGSW